MTLEQLRLNGLMALRERLGKAGMIRFLQQFDAGSGDYVDDRRDWVDSQSLTDLQSLAKQSSKTAPNPKTKKRRGQAN